MTDGLWSDLLDFLWSSCTFGCSGGSKPSDKEGWGGGFSHPDPEIRGMGGGGYHKKFFLGPLPWIRHWVEFWLDVTVYTVYTWLKKRRLNFIAFHFTFLCGHGNPPHASRYEREEEFMINSFKKTNKRSCFFIPPTHSLGDRPLEQSLCRAPTRTGLPTRGPMEVGCWKVRVYTRSKLVYLPFGTFFGASFWCVIAASKLARWVKYTQLLSSTLPWITFFVLRVFAFILFRRPPWGGNSG